MCESALPAYKKAEMRGLRGKPSLVGFFTLLTGIRFENDFKSHYGVNTSECTTDALRLVPAQRTSHVTNNVTRRRRNENSHTA